MAIPVYLKRRQKKTVSKYHQIQGRLSFKYQSLKREFASKFHKSNNIYNTQIDQDTLEFVTKHDFQLVTQDYLNKTFISGVIQPIKNSVSVFRGKGTASLRDWTRGRIAGRVLSIVIMEGVIVEKVFLTPQGNRISIKRHQLGIFSLF